MDKDLTPTGCKIGLLVTSLSLIIYAVGIPLFHTMELKAYDLHFFFFINLENVTIFLIALIYFYIIP